MQNPNDRKTKQKLPTTKEKLRLENILNQTIVKMQLISLKVCTTMMPHNHNKRNLTYKTEKKKAD